METTITYVVKVNSGIKYASCLAYGTASNLLKQCKAKNNGKGYIEKVTITVERFES